MKQSLPSIGHQVNIGKWKPRIGPWSMRNPPRRKVRQPRPIDRGSHRQQIFRVARETARHLHHRRKVRLDLAPTRPRQQRNPRLVRIQVVMRCISLPRHRRQRSLRQRMTHELCIHPPASIKLFLERKNREHLRDPLLHPAQTPSFPGPKLRRHKPNHRNAQLLQDLSQPEVHIREVDQHRNIRPHLPDRPHQLPVLPINIRRMPDHLGDPHMCHILRPHHPIHPRRRHLPPTQPKEPDPRQSANHPRPIVVPRSLPR